MERGGDGHERSCGFYPLCALRDLGAEGTRESLAVKLQLRNAGANTAAHHIAVTKQASVQLPGHRLGDNPGRKVLVRADGAGATHLFVGWLPRQRLTYSVGFSLCPATPSRSSARSPTRFRRRLINTDGGER